MTLQTKYILKEAINIFLASTSEEKERLTYQVETNLSIHYNGLNNLGMGLEKDKVRAGEIFIRIFGEKRN